MFLFRVGSFLLVSCVVFFVLVDFSFLLHTLTHVYIRVYTICSCVFVGLSGFCSFFIVFSLDFMISCCFLGCSCCLL